MPQLVSTGTWFPFDHIRRDPDADVVEYLLALDPQCQFDMIMAQFGWAKTSIDYLVQLGKTFDATVSKSPVSIRQAIVHHWLEAVVVAVAATEEYLTHITAGIERLQDSTNVRMSSDETLAHYSLLEKCQLFKGRYGLESRLAMNSLACKVDGVCLDSNFLLFNPEITPEKALSPGAILRLIGIPAEHKQSFFLEAVQLWCQMQSSQDFEDIPKFGKAASRLLCVTDHFWKTASYQTEAEAAAAQSAAADQQVQLPATVPGYGLEDQAKDAADGAEIGVEPQSPRTVLGDQDYHTIQPESPNTVIGDTDGYAPLGDLE